MGSRIGFYTDRIVTLTTGLRTNPNDMRESEAIRLACKGDAKAFAILPMPAPEFTLGFTITHKLILPRVNSI